MYLILKDVCLSTNMWNNIFGFALHSTLEPSLQPTFAFRYFSHQVSCFLLRSEQTVILLPMPPPHHVVWDYRYLALMYFLNICSTINLLKIKKKNECKSWASGKQCFERGAEKNGSWVDKKQIKDLKDGKYPGLVRSVCTGVEKEMLVVERVRSDVFL
jgi:hypothetical protein